MLRKIFVFFSFILSVHSFCPKLFDNQTVCSCDSTVEGPVIRCSGTDGLLIVDKLRGWKISIKEFALESANIIEIGPRAFKNLQIKKLNLDKNRIQKIHENAFRGLENVLQDLSISENSLTEVPTKALSGLKVLNILNLKSNKIRNISTEAFVNMPSLIDMNLGCNQICELAANTFKNVQTSLQNLILDGNCMNSFPHLAVSNMINLIALHVKYNKISSLNQNDLTNLTSLSMLSLNGNEISEIKGGALVNTPNLRYLYLNENNIQNFDHGTMEQFKQVQVIDLSFNNISEITSEMFQGLESIQHLNLDSNRIKTIAPGAFSGTPLLLLWLPNNCLTEITQSTFQGAPFLRMVSLSSNNIKSIQGQSFGHLVNLHTLDLANNRIVSLQNESLAGTENLSVRLQENPMVCTQNGFHVWNGNEAINLTSEANNICKTSWQEETPNLCLPLIRRPAGSTCSTSHYYQTTTASPQPAEQIQSMTENTFKKSDANFTESRNEETVQETTEQSETVTLKTETTNIHRKVNMERFLRLSKGPSRNSPFMRHAQGSKPKYLQTTTTTTRTETSDEEESDEAEYLSDEEQEEDGNQEREVIETKTDRNLDSKNRRNNENSSQSAELVKIPARIRERQKMFAKNIPPWMTDSNEQENVNTNFNEDGKIKTVTKSDE